MLYYDNSIVPSMSSIEVTKNCVYIEVKENKNEKEFIYYIKKECILGYKGYEYGYLGLAIKIYTNIPDTEICVEFRGENYGEKYRNFRAILDNILSPEVEQPTVQTTADNVLKN